jgi:hypothetical protein
MGSSIGSIFIADLPNDCSLEIASEARFHNLTHTDVVTSNIS